MQPQNWKKKKRLVKFVTGRLFQVSPENVGHLISLVYPCLLQNRQQLWEQELYHQFKYKTPREYFHTFEADVSSYWEMFVNQVEWGISLS